MDYITFMHNNAESEPTQEDWDRFFSLARESGLFRGGSEVGARSTVGEKEVPDITRHVVGYMRFDSATLSELTELLRHHSMVVNGGTVEVCELPRS